ncbi:XRE family transcriptional regulator [Couchioplanes azureus]|uniref:XRE family transcriptional regulator n=1 Tax=Couchioplanes caeruleus TaxID=56438 RepID=UPI0016710EBE|nr:XRE family transcriptional regulator [Couchioplanes caeruleus]GGQ63954.1 hypothetical protein GCM10010166_37270 [Couchioplanes caeruleus subsp. azureus]
MPEADPNAPSPEAAATPAEYVTALRALRAWSGLTYRQLAAKAEASGDVLPSSTIASALGRSTLPRQQVVTAFARACGLSDAAVAQWVSTRDALAAGRTPAPAPGATIPPRPPMVSSRPSGAADEATPESMPAPAAPAENPPAGAPAGRRLRAVVAVAALLAATGVVAVIAGDGLHSGDGKGAAPSGAEGPRRGGAGAAPASSPLADGWYLLRPAHVDGHGLCLGEGRERNGRTDRPLAVQRPCDRVSPDTYLRAAGPGVVEIQWRHPRQSLGCLTVDEAYPGDGALLAPADCTGAAHQRYLLEAVDAPVPGGYRLRPVHSGLCVGILGGPAETSAGAEAVQTHCTGAADQELVLTPTEQHSRP